MKITANSPDARFVMHNLTVILDRGGLEFAAGAPYEITDCVFEFVARPTRLGRFMDRLLGRRPIQSGVTYDAQTP